MALGRRVELSERSNARTGPKVLEGSGEWIRPRGGNALEDTWLKMPRMGLKLNSTYNEQQPIRESHGQTGTSNAMAAFENQKLTHHISLSSSSLCMLGNTCWALDILNIQNILNIRDTQESQDTKDILDIRDVQGILDIRMPWISFMSLNPRRPEYLLYPRCPGYRGCP